MIDRLLDRLIVGLQKLLAFAFLFAIGANFANVIGRYLFGRSILWADEVQMFILVLLTFVGVVVVSWRRQHLRMDVVFNLLPAPVRTAIRVLETAALLVLSAVVASQSYLYATQMMLLGRVSDNAGIPMWIPHSSVAIGFALIALVAVWHTVGPQRHTLAATSGPGPSADDTIKPGDAA